MSYFKRIVGINPQKAPTLHHAIMRLRAFENDILRKQNLVKNHLTREIAFAKKNVATNTKAVVQAIQRKKGLERQIRQFSLTLDMIQLQIEELENEKIKRLALESMDKATKALKKMQNKKKFLGINFQKKPNLLKVVKHLEQTEEALLEKQAYLHKELLQTETKTEPKESGFTTKEAALRTIERRTRLQHQLQQVDLTLKQIQSQLEKVKDVITTKSLKKTLRQMSVATIFVSDWSLFEEQGKINDKVADLIAYSNICESNTNEELETELENLVQDMKDLVIEENGSRKADIIIH